MGGQPVARVHGRLARRRDQIARCGHVRVRGEPRKTPPRGSRIVDGRAGRARSSKNSHPGSPDDRNLTQRRTTPAADRQIKTLVYHCSMTARAVLLRGDHQLNAAKLPAAAARPAHPGESKAALGAPCPAVSARSA